MESISGTPNDEVTAPTTGVAGQSHDESASLSDGQIDLDALVDKVYRLMKADIRLERARSLSAGRPNSR